MNFRKRYLNEDQQNLTGHAEAAATLRKLMSKQTGYKEFVDLLDSTLKTDYGEFVDILRAGRKDGNLNDEAVDMKVMTVPVKSLLPTQSQIGIKQSLDVLLEDEYGNAHLMFAGKANKISILDPVITYGAGAPYYIIDGHHRWSQIYCGNYNGSIKILNITTKQQGFANDYEYALKLGQLAIAAQTRAIFRKGMEGDNLLQVNHGYISRYIRSKVSPRKPGGLLSYVERTLGEVYKPIYFDDYIGQFIDFMWENISMMQKKNSPPATATPRIDMPQLDKAPKFASLLKKGILNYIDPMPSDASKKGLGLGDILKFKAGDNPKKMYAESTEKIRRIVREELRKLGR